MDNNNEPNDDEQPEVIIEPQPQQDDRLSQDKNELDSLELGSTEEEEDDCLKKGNPTNLLLDNETKQEVFMFELPSGLKLHLASSKVDVVALANLCLGFFNEFKVKKDLGGGYFG